MSALVPAVPMRSARRFRCARPGSDLGGCLCFHVGGNSRDHQRRLDERVQSDGGLDACYRCAEVSCDLAACG